MEKVLISFEEDHVRLLDKIVQEAKFGTDRSKVVRAILNDYFSSNGVRLND